MFLQAFSMCKLCLFFLLVFLSFSCTLAKTEISQTFHEPVASLAVPEITESTNFSPANGKPGPLLPAGKTLVVRFGPQLVELKASYLEKGEMPIDPNGISQDGSLRRYLNLFATSSFGGFTGESEVSYSLLNSLSGQCSCEDWPRMLRLGLKNHWRGLGYGVAYKSVDRGFVTLDGVTTEQTRDEGLLWGEHRLGPFNLRGSIGESWEKLLDGTGSRVARGATASLNLDRSQWGAKFVSSYEWVEPGVALNQETRVFTNTLTGSYRPFDFLSVNPNFSIKEERNPYTGARIETPRTELIFGYTGLRNSFKLTGSTSFARSLGSEGLNHVRTFGTAAAVDWKIGKFLGKDDFLSFNLRYNQQLGFISPGNSYNDLSGLLQLRVTGF